MESFRGQSLTTIVRRTRVPMALGETRVAANRIAGLAVRTTPADPSDKLRFLVDVDTYPPTTRAGSERSLDAVLRWLAAREHEVRVLVPADQISGEFGGVTVITAAARDRRAEYRWSNVVGTQLATHNRVARLARRERRPFVHFLRMGYFNRLTTYGKPDLLVYNAAWIQAKFPWPGESMVVHAPIFPEEFRTARGENVTLINLSEKKGGQLLAPLAERLPDHQFLGVLGGWGDQVVPDPQPPNVTLIENTSDIRSVYARTRVLLHPSRQEAYGRIGLEAAASGIPTIAHPLTGTRESLGDSAIYVHIEDLDEWAAAIRRLDDPDEYRRWSERALARSSERDPRPELEELEAALLRLTRQGNHTP